MAAAGAIGKSIGATEASAKPEEDNIRFLSLSIKLKAYFVVMRILVVH